MAILFPIPSFLDPALPLLALLGFLVVVGAVLLAALWPRVEGLIIGFLTERRRARELRDWQRTQRKGQRGLAGRR